MRTRATTTLAAFLIAALTACGSGSDGSAAPASDSRPADAGQTTAVPAGHEADDLKAAVHVNAAA